MYGFQRWREAFCLRVFCLAWARILLVFRSFRIWRWRDFEQPSFGIHVSNGFLLGRGSTAAGVRVFRFLWVPKVTWSILSACFLLGMGSNLAGVSVFSNLTLTRLWAAIVRNPRFERFFAWQRLDCCWRSGVSEPKLCLFFMGFKGDVKHSVCVFFAWHGLESCWFLVFSNLTLTRFWAAIVRNPRSCLWLYVRFERFFAWQRLDCCWRSGVSFFMGLKGDVKHSVCVFFAWHGLESCWCFGLFESDADETFSSHRSESTFRTVFRLAEARLLLAFGCFGTEALFVFYGFQRWREAFCLRVFCLAWARILLVFRSFRIWRWRDFDQPSFGIHVSNGFLLGRGSTAAGVRVFRFLWVPKVTWSILSACFLLGMGSNLAGVSVFSNLTLTRLWAAIVRNPRSCLWLYVRFERFFAWQRLDCCWRSGVSFFMGSKGDVKHSVCVFFAWHGLESCWCFGLFESDADETFSSHRSESTFRTVFCLAEARLLLAFGCFGTEALFVFYGFQRWREAFCLRVFCLAWARILLVFRSFRIWRWRDFEQPSFGIHVSNGFLLGRGSTAAGVRVFRNRSFVFYGFQRWREAFCLRVFCLAWARILLVFRSFRIWRWRDFEQPSFGIHVPASACGYMCVSNGFLLGRG